MLIRLVARNASVSETASVYQNAFEHEHEHRRAEHEHEKMPEAKEKDRLCITSREVSIAVLRMFWLSIQNRNSCSCSKEL